MQMKNDAVQRAKKIRVAIFDVDGVLTDGNINWGPEGELFKSFSCKDGLGITLWHRSGGKSAIISGRDGRLVTGRMEPLGIHDFWYKCADKRQAYRELCEKFNVTPEETMYVGDDIIDLPLMKQAGLAAAPSDGAAEAREYAQIVSSFPGGKGAVREIMEFVMKVQGNWERLVAQYMEDAPIENSAQ